MKASTQIIHNTHECLGVEIVAPPEPEGIPSLDAIYGDTTLDFMQENPILTKKPSLRRRTTSVVKD